MDRVVCLHVKKGDLIFKIKEGEEMVGTLKVSDTRVCWAPKNEKEDKGMLWPEFNARIREK